MEVLEMKCGWLFNPYWKKKPKHHHQLKVNPSISRMSFFSLNIPFTVGRTVLLKNCLSTRIICNCLPPFKHLVVRMFSLSLGKGKDSVVPCTMDEIIVLTWKHLGYQLLGLGQYSEISLLYFFTENQILDGIIPAGVYIKQLHFDYRTIQRFQTVNTEQMYEFLTEQQF